MIIYIIEVLCTLHSTLMGKGSRRRPTNETVYNREWDKIFNKKDKDAKNKKANEQTIKSTNTV